MGEPDPSVSESYAQDKLCIHMLGPPQVMWNGRLLKIPRRQVRHLLFVLAATPQPAPRDQIYPLFWESDTGCCARRMSHLLTHLRQILPQPTLLQTTNEYIYLCPEAVYSDVVAFRQFANAKESLTIDQLAQTIQLYRGSFLESCYAHRNNSAYENWVLGQRHELERTYLLLLKRLLDAQVGQNTHAAIETARLYLATDPLSETVHHQLMILHHQIGDRRAALQQFYACEKQLKEELGIAPQPEMVTLYQQLRSDEWQKTPALAPVVSIRPVDMGIPLVGIEPELDALRVIFTEACQGNGRVVLLSGERGVGKTRLIEAFATSVKQETPVIFCTWPPGCQFAYFWLARKLIAFAKNTHAHFHPCLNRLLELEDTLWPTTAAGELAQIEEAIYQLILDITRRNGRFIICLDNLEAADSATLHLITRLGQQMAGLPLFVLGGYCCQGTPNIMQLQQQLNTLGVLIEKKISGMDLTAIRALLTHLFGDFQGRDELAQQLRTMTGGNTFFVVEVVRALAESEAAAFNHNHLDIPIPQTIEQVITNRLQNLSPLARQILEAGAVIGYSFTFATLQQTSGRGEAETMTALQELIARYLLTACGKTYRFQHQIIQENVLATMETTRRHLLQRRAGRLLPHHMADPVR